MDAQLEKKIRDILYNLPASGDTLYPSATYEMGVEEVLLYLLGEITAEEFDYSGNKQQ